MDRSFCIKAGCGGCWETAAGVKKHYKEAHDHEAGERQAPEELEDLEGPEEQHNMVHQGTQSVATGRQAVYTGAKGTKRPESGRKTPPNAKRRRLTRAAGDMTEQQAS